MAICSLTVMSLLSFTTRPSSNMAANTCRRCFSVSSSSAIGAAADVKRLGVVGAGQMVNC